MLPDLAFNKGCFQQGSIQRQNLAIAVEFDGNAVGRNRYDFGVGYLVTDEHGLGINDSRGIFGPEEDALDFQKREAICPHENRRRSGTACGSIRCDGRYVYRSRGTLKPWGDLRLGLRRLS